MTDFANPFNGFINDSAPTINSNNLRPNQIELVDLPPAAFDQLAKILILLQDQGIISINNSIICQSLINKGTSILKCDISQISSNLQLHISNPKKYVKYFKSIKGNSNVKIIDDDEQKRFIITNNEIKLLLPKQLDSVIEDMSPPDLSNVQLLGDENHSVIKISKEVRESIKNITTGSEYVDILIKNNNALAIYVPETAVINFPNVKEDIDETNADLILRSYSFLTIDSDEYNICIGKLDDDYWTLTSSKIGIMDIFLMEKVQAVSNENMLI